MPPRQLLTFGRHANPSVAGILGENVPIPEQITQTVGQFWIVNIATLCACMICFAAL